MLHLAKRPKHPLRHPKKEEAIAQTTHRYNRLIQITQLIKLSVAIDPILENMWIHVDIFIRQSTGSVHIGLKGTIELLEFC